MRYFTGKRQNAEKSGTPQSIRFILLALQTSGVQKYINLEVQKPVDHQSATWRFTVTNRLNISAWTDRAPVVAVRLNNNDGDVHDRRV